MYVRLISDLHIDVNEDKPFSIENNDVFTIVAGDTAGEPQLAIDWIKKNVSKGIVITGNHLVYNSRNKTVEELKQEIVDAFPISNPVSYLDVSVKQFHKKTCEPHQCN